MVQLLRFRTNGMPRVGVVQDGSVVDLARGYGIFLAHNGHSRPHEAAAELFTSSLTDLAALQSTSGLADAMAHALDGAASKEGSGAVHELSGLDVLAPLTVANRIFGIGRNYAAHVAEAKVQSEPVPRVFIKLSSSLIGPGDAIVPSPAVTELDFEGELAVVIGKAGSQISEERALEHVFAYTIANDVSAREVQRGHGVQQTSFAKSMDTFCPCGPFLTLAERGAPAPDLQLRTWLNDELMQDARTSEMVHDVPTIISHLSNYVRLVPGDAILTGTPSGVGAFRDPPVFLKAGDRLRMEIEGLGALENEIAAV